MKHFGYIAANVLVVTAIVGLWAAISDLKLVSPIFLPGPDRAWSVIWQAAGTPLFWQRIEGTLMRMALGWLLASLIGIVVGGCIGMSPVARSYLNGTLEFIRPIPASAIVPAGILIFGLNEGMVLAVIAFGAIWPTLLATAHGFASVSSRLREVDQLLGFNRAQYVVKIAFPSAFPGIFSGARISLTVSLILTIVVEMVAGRTGVGSWIMLSARGFRSADVFAGVILFGVIGALSGLLLGVLEWRLLHRRA